MTQEIPMTPNVRACPECGAQSKLVDRQTYWNQEMRHVRVCTECPTEYVVSYANPVIEEVTTHE